MSDMDFESLGYFELKTMGDGTVCGLHHQLFTCALVVGLNETGYQRRYCYERARDALSALHGWNGTGDPSGPWIKEKPSDRLGPGALGSQGAKGGE